VACVREAVFHGGEFPNGSVQIFHIDPRAGCRYGARVNLLNNILLLALNALLLRRAAVGC
jgi:hypothetical protein